jgi:hypothetical protein
MGDNERRIVGIVYLSRVSEVCAASIISLHHEIIVWLSSGSMSDRDDGVCRMAWSLRRCKRQTRLTSESVWRDTPLGISSAEPVVPMVSVQTMRTRSIERWQDLRSGPLQYFRASRDHCLAVFK